MIEISVTNNNNQETFIPRRFIIVTWISFKDESIYLLKLKFFIHPIKGYSPLNVRNASKHLIDQLERILLIDQSKNT